MKKLKFLISFAAIAALLASCQKDDYQSLVKKIQINPKYEMQPPIAKNIFIQELEKSDKDGNNIKFIAEFDKEAVKDKYLAIMLNDKKVVLRDDGKGADEVSGDHKFSLNMNENLNELKSDLDQRKKTESFE